MKKELTKFDNHNIRRMRNVIIKYIQYHKIRYDRPLKVFTEDITLGDIIRLWSDYDTIKTLFEYEGLTVHINRIMKKVLK